MSKHTIAACLVGCGIASVEAFVGCQTVDDEFSKIKKSYLKLVLQAHPDKGGDAQVFIQLRDHWEVVRMLYDEGRVHASGFTYYLGVAGRQERSSAAAAQHSDGDTPSWSWFEAAQHENVPPYRCEAARSAQSACKSKKCGDPMIGKGELRCGSLDAESGTYGRWHHIKCWRVPASVWMALPDVEVCRDAARFEAALAQMSQIAFCGFAELSPTHKQEFVAHCMNKENYARATVNSKAYNAAATDDADADAKARTGAARAPTSAAASAPAAPASATASARPSTSSTSTASSASSTSSTSAAFAAAPPHAHALVARAPIVSASTSALAHYAPPPTTQLAAAGGGAGQGGRFVVPRPGVNGARADAFRGKSFVLTGVFPEVGGGAGLNLGKDRVKAMIESFGGRVTGSVSGRTDYVLVGAQPGAVKVSAAHARGIPTPDIHGLKLTLETEGATLELAAPAQITSLSRGYRGNGLGRLAYDAPAPTHMLGGGGDAGDGGASGGFRTKKKRTAAKPKAPKAPKQPRVSKKAAAAAAAAAAMSTTAALAMPDHLPPVEPKSKKRRTTV